MLPDLSRLVLDTGVQTRRTRGEREREEQEGGSEGGSDSEDEAPKRFRPVPEVAGRSAVKVAAGSSDGPMTEQWFLLRSLPGTADGSPTFQWDSLKNLQTRRRDGKEILRKYLVSPRDYANPSRIPFGMTRVLPSDEADALLLTYQPDAEQWKDRKGKSGWVRRVVQETTKRTRATSGGVRGAFRVEWAVDDDVVDRWELKRYEVVWGSELTDDAWRFVGRWLARRDSSPPAPAPPAGPVQSVIQWGWGRGMQLSLQRAIQQYGDKVDTLALLREYTVQRMWALRSQVPPPLGEGGPDAEQMAQLGYDLFELRMDEMKKTFRAIQRADARQQRLAEGGQGEEEQGEGEQGEEEQVTAAELADAEDDPAWGAFRDETEAGLAKAASEAWELVRGVYDADIVKLVFQLDQIAAAERQPRRPDDFSDRRFLGMFSQPPLQLPHVHDFLTQGQSGSRSAPATAWLDWLRARHTEMVAGPQRDTDRDNVGGSAYMGSWPLNPGRRTVPPDHVVPQRWMNTCELLVEQPEPKQLPAVVLCTERENSQKKDKALWIFDERALGAVPPGCWKPPNAPALVASSNRYALLARSTCWVFGLYWGISNHSNETVGVEPYTKTMGVAWYAGGFERDGSRFKARAKAKATDFERRVHLLTMSMQNWRFGNPLVFNEKLFDADLEWLLKRRFRGEDEMTKLVEYVLTKSVAGAPRAAQ